MDSNSHSQRKRQAASMSPSSRPLPRPTHPPPSSKAKRRRRRMRDIEREAANRTLNGNGRSPNLPPLPIGDAATATDDGEDEGDCGGSLGTLFGHPYGALPHGNSLADTSGDPDKVRRTGLGIVSVLNDEQVLAMASFLPGEDLARLVRCSRFWYVAGHHEELWRDLTLRAYGETGVDFRGGWRDTFVYRSCQVREASKAAAAASSAQNEVEKDDENEEAGSSTPLLADASDPSSPTSMSAKHAQASDDDGSLNSFQPHKPIKVAGIYSDTFFRSWLCRSFALQPSWLSVESVPREDAESLSTERFLSEYENVNRPVIITGASKSWPAVQNWDRPYLIEQTKGASFRATSGAAPLPAKFTMQSYAQYCDAATEEAPLYLFDRTFDAVAPQLALDYDEALRRTCPYFDPAAPHGHDLFGLLGKERRPDHRWLIVGPKRSGSCFHIDPNCTHAWNAPIRGRKRWIFYPPGVSPPGVHPSLDGDDVVMPISIGEWFLTFWPEHVRRRSDPDPTRRPLECTVAPGDVLFVPHGWWHTVLNLDDGLSVALTQNYVSRSNLGDVLRFLERRQGQISGCRDRPEAVRPERFLGEFRSALEKNRPDLLLEGERAAAGGWNCNAWTDDAALDGGHVSLDADLEAKERSGDGCNDDETKKKRKNCKMNGSRSKIKRSILDRAKCSCSDDQATGQEAVRDGGQGGFSFSFL